MEGNTSITPGDFDDLEAYYDPKVMDFAEFEDYLVACEEKDFFIIMRDVYSTIKYLVDKGMDEEAIYTWIGNVNNSLRGRNFLWKKAFIAARAESEIQTILDKE